MQHGLSMHAGSTQQNVVSYEIALKSKKQIAVRTHAFTFEKPEGFHFNAGQHVRMSLIDPSETDAEGNKRFLTIASTPQEADLVFAMRMRDTAFKRVLGRMQPGAKVRIDIMLHAQHKSFMLDKDASKPAVFLIGGIGIVPAYAIIKDAMQRKLPHTILLFYSNRRPEDAPFLDELQAIAKQNPSFKLVATMTEPEKSATGWQGETGVINQAMLKKYINDLDSPIYYIAGLSGMVNAMKKVLADASVSKDSIRAEDFSGFKMHIMTRLPITWKNRLPFIVTIVVVAVIVAIGMHVVLGAPTHTAGHGANIFSFGSIVIHFVVLSVGAFVLFKSGHLSKRGARSI
jgi:ferredoxin-NADP reductase